MRLLLAIALSCSYIPYLGCASFGNPPPADWRAPSERAARVLSRLETRAQRTPVFRVDIVANTISEAVPVGDDLVLSLKWDSDVIGPLIRLDPKGQTRWRLHREGSSSTLGHDGSTLWTLDRPPSWRPRNSDEKDSIGSVSLENGMVIARRTFENASAAFAKNSVVVLETGSTSTLSRFDGPELTPSWSTAASGATMVKLVGDKVFLLGDGAVQLVDLRRGNPLAKHPLAPLVDSTPVPIATRSGLIVWQLAVQSQVTHFGSDGSSWPRSIPGNFSGEGYGIVLIESGEGTLSAHAEKDGKELWRHRLAAKSRADVLRFTDGRPAVWISEPERLVVLTGSTGTERLVIQIDGDEERERATDVFLQTADGLVVWDTARFLTGFEPDGRVRFRHRLRTSPLIGSAWGVSDTTASFGKSLSIRQRLHDIETGELLVRPLTWDLGEGLLVVRKRDGAATEVVVGPSELYTSGWRAGTLSIARTRPDGVVSLVTMGLGLDPSRWPPSQGSTTASFVARTLLGFTLEPSAFVPAARYAETSLIPDSAFRLPPRDLPRSKVQRSEHSLRAHAASSSAETWRLQPLKVAPER